MVVFWDGGAEKVLQPVKFPLKGDQPGRLYLLYGREDLLARRDALRRQYPDLAGLRVCYTAIRNRLREQGACQEAQLRQLTAENG